MRIGFIQILRKNIKPELFFKAHFSPIDAFSYATLISYYATVTIPKMEQEIQTSYLRSVLSKIQHEDLKQEIIQSYIRRKLVKKKYEPPFKPQMDKPLKHQILPEAITGQCIIPKPINFFNQYVFNNYQYIGYYCYFSISDYNKYFPNKIFGIYHSNEYVFSKKFCIMARDLALRAIRCIEIIRNSPNKFNFDNIFDGWNQKNIHKFINHQQNYIQLFQQISWHLQTYLKKYTNNPQYNKFFINGVMQDTIIANLINIMPKVKNPLPFISHIVEQIMKNKKSPAVGQIDLLIKLPIDNITIHLKPKMLPKRCRYFHRTPSFKNVFFEGQAGSGKSMVLSFISMYACKTGCIVINVTQALAWTQDKLTQIYTRHLNGLWNQQQQGVKWLKSFKSANQDFLKQMKVNDQFGQYDITGIHKDEYQPVPNLYDPRRKVYFNQIDDKMFDKNAKQLITEEYLEYYGTPLINLLSPKTVLDIVEFGINNQIYSINCIAQALHQVRVQDKIPVVMLVDSVNWFYKPSIFLSYRYVNNKGLNGKIPPYHLSLCRLFMNLDGHKIRYGIKYVASSCGTIYRHTFDVKKIYLPELYGTQVKNLSRRETINAVTYWITNNIWPTQNLNKSFAQQHLYSLSSGNWHAIKRHCELQTIYG